uniref:Protein atonal homolog 8 n=1 Tax=Takifugu rubripes TaxID=31033 RepID=A0A674NSW1_TAKRU|eukprot:XP_011608685.1 PREDICTED: protein atonal homolog 8 isoform X1 [Takifugu rubripes]
MKNPHPLCNTWARSINEEPTLITAPEPNKKFKRKSREPKRLKTFPSEMSDVDMADDIQTCDISMLAPLQRKLIMSQDVMASPPGILSGLPEGSLALAQSAAIDMRIGINLPAIPSKMAQLPASTFPNLEISQWPPAISQPLTNRLKLGLCSPFTLSTSTSSSSSSSRSPGNQEPSLAGQTATLPGPRASQTPQYHNHMDPQVQSLKESPRKRVGLTEDGPGQIQEVKAIQQTRRLLANARERTRVHTISAAFEALRKQVPCYSYGQKLSKLAILRIACNYILSLAQLAELDYSNDHNSVNFSQCVEQCTRTLQAEGRSKKRKVSKHCQRGGLEVKIKESNQVKSNIV